MAWWCWRRLFRDAVMVLLESPMRYVGSMMPDEFCLMPNKFAC